MLQGAGHGATESVVGTSAILPDHFEYCRIDCHTIATKIRAPEISFGMTRRKKDKQVLLSKHKRVTIE